MCFINALFVPPSSAPSCPGTAAQRVQPTAQLAGTVPQSHPQRATHAPERHLSRVLPAATQRGRQQQQRRRWRRRRWKWFFSHLSQLSVSPFSSQQWYLSKLSCQLGALQSIPTARYAKYTHVPDPGQDAKLLCFSGLLLSCSQHEANC